MQDTNSVNNLETWIDKITNSDIRDLVNDCHDEECDIVEVSERKVLKISEEDDTIVYTDGSKYVGNIEDGRPNGQGQLSLPDDRILR